MGPAKDKHGVRESFTEVQFYFAKNEWPFPVEKIRSTATHIRTYHLTFCLTYMTFYLNIYSDFLSGILSGISGARCQDFTVEKQGTEADKLDRKIDSIG